MNLRPLADRVVVKPLEREGKTKGGIVLPDTVKERPQEGEVMAIGNGKLLDTGKRAPLSVKKGDKILYGKYSGNEIKVNNQEYLIMTESEILAKVE
ncbi:MAG: co-chaperone GroES [Planctomycetes bacterium]|nr:co-chaperone GroES [Planctomycetota bacterium]